MVLEHGLMDKNVFFESSVHVPFLVRYPDRLAPGKRNELVEMVDLTPSLLEFCNVPVPKRVQGRSFARGPANREIAFSENIIPEIITGGALKMAFVPGQGVAGIRHPDAKMVRTQRWKFNYYPGHGAELYDLENDPHEARNLASDPAHQKVALDLKASLLDWMITADENDQIAEKWLL